ncbi:MAG: hypothetical protein J6J97_08445 [Akkermansia sp.]|nr:hypothetical protein [Akkermansia sp.]MBQ8376032.1 hypothetical protein [Akkermansia sp.]
MKKCVMMAVVVLAGLVSGCMQTAEEKMIADLVKKDRWFDAQKQYERYVLGREEYLSELRKTAVGAADMRVELSLDYGKEVEYMPLSEGEIATVREVFSALENTPPRDFNRWLKEKHDSSFGPQPAACSYGVELQFLSADGKVERSFYDVDEVKMGDKAQAEQYRTAPHRPDYMLPADLLQHWNALPFRAAAKKRMHELLTAREQERAKALNLPGSCGSH